MGGYVTPPDASFVASPVDGGGPAVPVEGRPVEGRPVEDSADGRPVEGPVEDPDGGPDDGCPAEGLVAGAAGGGAPGRSAAAAAPPPAMTRQAPAASAATRRRCARLPRSAMRATGAAPAWACPASPACRNKVRSGSWISDIGDLLASTVICHSRISVFAGYTPVIRYSVYPKPGERE